MKLLFEDISKSYQKIITKTISKFISTHNLNPDIQISIYFLSQAKIRALNNKYRHINKATDVLSFPIWKSLSSIPKSGPTILGDIFICPDKTKVDLNLSGLVEHSLNHLIGKHE